MLGRRENGRNLVQVLRANPKTVDTPIIVITGEDEGRSEFILSVMRVGGMERTEYIQKPIDGDKLDQAIERMLAKKGEIPEKLSPFCSEERRLLEIGPEKVLLCGVQVWTDCSYPEMGQILGWLAERDKHGFVRLSGTEISKRLNRDSSNPIGQPVKRFRDTCREKMASCMHLDCGVFDVIGSTRGGGYHFTENIEVRILGATPVLTPEAVTKPEPPPVPELPNLNPRQRWIVAQIALGSDLRQKTVIEHFRREANASTIKRDLKELRDMGVIVTKEDGTYSLPSGRKGV